MGFIEFFTTLAERYGLFGIFIGAALESIGVPFANSAQILASGTLIEEYGLTFTGIIIAGTLGNSIGSSIGYFIGYFLGNNIRKFRKEHKLFKNEAAIHDLIDKYGTPGVFIAQLYGTTRTFISIPAGMLRMRFKPFIIYTTLGGLVFSLIVTVFSLMIKDLYDRYLLPVLGLSYISAALSFMLLFLVITYVIKKGDRIRNHLSKLFK